jgi:hypothetical protein
MSTQHTKGRLQIAQHYSDAVSIIDLRGFEIIEVPNMPILSGYQEKLGISHWATRPGEAFIEIEPEEHTAIVRRVVAAWNACEGVETDWLERCGGAEHTRMFSLPHWVKHADELRAQRDQLLKALQSVLQWIDDNCETSGFEAVEAQADAAIAACEPAPAVVHLPNDDTEGGAA